MSMTLTRLPKLRKRKRQLDADGAAADDRQMLRRVIDLKKKNVLIGQRTLRRQTRHSQQKRGRAPVAITMWRAVKTRSPSLDGATAT